MKFWNNNSPWRLKRVSPVKTYFTDEVLPPGGHIETDQALPADEQIEENLDCSYLLHGLWPEATKKWFVWNDNEWPRILKVAVDIEELCQDIDIKKLWWTKVRDFVEFKASYDEKKATGKYVDPAKDWPFNPCHSRAVNLPDDLPAIYALLCRFHDWLRGFDELFFEENPAIVEFSYDPSQTDYERQLEQRSIRIEELEDFLKIVKKDIENNRICRHSEVLIENESQKISDKIENLDDVDKKIIALSQQYETDKGKKPNLKFPSSRKIAAILEKVGLAKESHVKVNNRIRRLRSEGLIDNPRKSKEHPYDPKIIEQQISNGRKKQVKAIE